MHNNRPGTFRILNVVANKWTAVIIECLATGDKRPIELMDRIGGISQKMLTQTLRQLEGHRLVARKVYAVVPPRVDYGLTPLGFSLLKPLEALHRWAGEHAAEIAEAETQILPDKEPRE